MTSLPGIEELNCWSIEELQTTLREIGLDTEGTKDVQVQCLFKAVADDDQEQQAVTVDPYALAVDAGAADADAADDLYAAVESPQQIVPPADQKISRKRSRSPGVCRGWVRRAFARRIADDLLGCGLKEKLGELEASLAAGRVPSKVMLDQQKPGFVSTGSV